MLVILDHVIHSGAQMLPSREEGGPRGRAYRGSRMKVTKAHSTRRQFIQGGRMHRPPVTPNILGAEVVSQQQDHIRTLFGCRGLQHLSHRRALAEIASVIEGQIHVVRGMVFLEMPGSVEMTNQIYRAFSIVVHKRRVGTRSQQHNADLQSPHMSSAVQGRVPILGSNIWISAPPQ